jgi:hypothetical protein
MDPTLTWTVAAVFSMLFAASAAMKFTDLSRFAAAVGSYRVLPRIFIAPAAFIIPVAEGAGALGLLFPKTRIMAGVLIAALLAMFTGAIAINLMRGRRDIDCGCFGAALRQKLSGGLVARNLMLLAAITALAVPMRTRALGIADFTTIAFGAATLTTLYASLNYLLANAPFIRELERLHA